jgi:hypothetical protein
MAMLATVPAPVITPVIAAKVRPPTLAGERLLPVTASLQEILPAGGLQRGSTVVVDARKVDARKVGGATTLAVEMLVGVSVGGFWCAVAGFADLGIVAAAERGIDLARLILVPSLGPPDRWLQVVATLFDAVDAVLLVPRGAVRPSDARRLAARSRERGSVLLVLDQRGDWPGPNDLRCTVVRSEWSGLSKGYGLLTGRRFELEVSGRGAAARPRLAPLQLPA